ncbi:MAG TPA: hypothetical protein VJP77_05885 [Planctomycetota bacterium]|nr:hypothetical protein [Planctomycetota bacterium]
MPPWAKELLKHGGIGVGFVGAFLVIWFAIAQPMRDDMRGWAEGLEAKLGEVVKANQQTREELIQFRASFSEWTRQVFVSKDLFEQVRGEYERRIAALEKK